jgi:hypothetical protein
LRRLIPALIALVALAVPTAATAHEGHNHGIPGHEFVPDRVIQKDITVPARLIADAGVVADGTVEYTDQITLPSGEKLLRVGRITRVFPAPDKVLAARVAAAKSPARKAALRKVRSRANVTRKAERRTTTRKRGKYAGRAAFLGSYLNHDPALLYQVAFALDLHAIMFGGNSQDDGGFLSTDRQGPEGDVTAEGENNTFNGSNYCTWDEHSVGQTNSHYIGATGECLSGPIGHQIRSIGFGSPAPFHHLFHGSEPDGWSPDYPNGGS